MDRRPRRSEQYTNIALTKSGSLDYKFLITCTELIPLGPDRRGLYSVV